jgi:hypothetical protein
LAPRTPDAVDGRRHMDIQTETCVPHPPTVILCNILCRYLEEISDRPLEESLATQTDAMMDRHAPHSSAQPTPTPAHFNHKPLLNPPNARCDRPASPLFIPKKHGVDKETQVEGDLFDFDFEVQPLALPFRIPVMFCVRWNRYWRLWSARR